MRKIILGVGVLLILVVESASAQSFYAVRRERTLIATVGLNTSTYFGDLKDKGDLFDAKPSLSLGVMYYFNPRIAARAEFSWVTMEGDDADSKDRQNRNLSFFSSNYEFSTTGVINLFPNGQRYYQRPKLNAYGFAGVGLLYFNPKAELNGKTYALQPLKTEGVAYSRFALVIPYGIGGRVSVSPFFSVAVEIGWRKTFTDYLDDVSTDYLDYNSLSGVRQLLADRGPELGRSPKPEGAVRGNPDKDDSYALYSVRIEYYLPPNIFGGIAQKKLYRQKRHSYKRR
jgi:hypothetical protein